MTLLRDLLLLAAFGLLACTADTSDASVTGLGGALPYPKPLTLPAGLAYPWLARPAGTGQTLAARFAQPVGCRRVTVAAGSWGEWLRWLPMRPAGTKARTYSGTLKNRREVVAAVVDIDVGTQDLQQCADAVIRLRAEYLFSHDPNKVHFHLTTGYDFWFSDYVAGKTFKVRGEEVTPATRPAETPSHAALARYLVPTFGYAGTLSLSRELTPKPLVAVQPGDVLIHGGTPGHAVLVVDVAENPKTHDKFMLLAQSYMPAQNIHVLRENYGTSPWFKVGAEAGIVATPEWDFAETELARF